MAINPQMYVYLRPALSDLEACLPDVRCLHNVLFRTNLVIILGMMQVSKKIPFDDPQVLLGVRILYLVSNIIIAGIYLYLQNKINAKKGTLARALVQNDSLVIDS